MKLREILPEVLYDAAWIILAVLYYGIALIPAYHLLRSTSALPLPWRFFIYPVAFFLFIFALIALTGITKRFLRANVPGTYNYPGDRAVKTWIANMTIPQFLLVPFSRLILLNATLRFITYRLYGVRLHYSTSISTAAFLRDFDLLYIGKNTVIGPWVRLIAHLFPSPGKLIMGNLTIGDNCVISNETTLLPGATVGNNVFIDKDCILGIQSVIKDNCHIGFRTMIGNKSVIENDVRIGALCGIANRVRIHEGIRIPDFSCIPDDTIVDTQEKANACTLVAEGSVSGKTGGI